jgi:glycosyltransferase involved in cell wall biosynthesis
MRLLFDGRKLGDGGIGVYIENTVRGLLEQGDIEVTVISSPAQAERVSWRSDVSWIYDSSKQYSLNEYLLLARRIDFTAYDLYHSPHYTLPFGISIPAVVTIHDLIHIEHPEAFYYPLVAKRLIRSAVARASKVIAVSQDTRQALLRLTKSDPHKVIHIPNAIPPFLRSHDAVAGRADEVARVTERLAAAERYFVTVVSNCKPHKGVADLLRAWNECVERYEALESESPCPLLLIAGYGAEAIRRDAKLSELAQQTRGVRIVGAVEEDILRHLYRGAEALVVPSLAEGFCFPALEAQSVGTRVVCRPVAALQELVTENDLVARDTSVSALTAALLEAASKPRHSKVIVAAHLERFSLSRTTEKIRAVYRSIATHRERVAVG